MAINEKERMYLRDLAKKQLEYASTPENAERVKLWYAHNDCKVNNPRVFIEEDTFFHEVERPLVCVSEHGREIESQLLAHLIGREDIDDDRATPDCFNVYHPTWFIPFGLEEQYEPLEGSIAYQYKPYLHDLEQDFHKLGKSIWGYDLEAAGRKKAVAEDILGDILPVQVLSGVPSCCLTWIILKYMTMETMMISLYDYPDLLHKMMDMLTRDMTEYLRELEAAGFLIVNNGNQRLGQGTFAFTRELPAAGKTDTYTLKDMWGYLNSQETSGISGESFEEFFFPYYKKMADLFGLVNYGCCEPVHSIWHCLSQMDNLRKLSISPWCDETFMGDALRGKNIVYHRKPSPNYIGVDPIFDRDGFSEHIKTTLLAAQGCFLEISMRDIYSLQGEKGRAKMAVRLTKDLIEKHWA